ncbi:MAG: hypothetical protein DI582_07515 [Azospirillum brasilense]|nr:MAG: hypothetical protein DI582_07515 [Azospirillum brasilense]
MQSNQMNGHMFSTRQTHGFSLVELSIVLVILGLLTGGILGGQSLIRAAEIRSIGVDFNRFSTATYTFRDKYMGLPGDITNATQFWGAAHATPATCRTTASTTQATCDGDGNGNLTTTGGATNLTHEMHRYWQHLANAGLIEGTYTGVGANNPTSQDGSLPGVNSPRLRVGQSVFQARYEGSLFSRTDVYDGNYDHVYFFGIA